MSNLGLRRSLLSTTTIRHRLYIHERRYLSQTVDSTRPGTHSIVSGPLDPPLSELTMPDFYRTQILPNHASRPALISRHENNVRWNFAEFDVRIERMARGLLVAGVKPGDRVAAIMGNCSPEIFISQSCSAYAVLQWACARIGAILVTVNPAYKVHEIVAALNTVTASTLILTPTVRKSSLLQAIFDELPTLASTPAGEEINDPGLPSLRRIFVVDNTGDQTLFKKELNRGPCVVDLAEIASTQYGAEPQHEAEKILDRALDRHDVINLQFTSGTTGLPKAVSELIEQRPLGRALYAVFGPLDIHVAADIKTGSPIVARGDAFSPPPPSSPLPSPFALLVNSFSPKDIVQAVSYERCTAIHGVPTHFIGVLDELDRVGSGVDMSSLRTGIASGSAVPIDLIQKLIRRLNMRDLTISYGMTETRFVALMYCGALDAHEVISPVSFQNTPDDPLEMRIESVGKVQPHVRAKVIDEHGAIVPVGKHTALGSVVSGSGRSDATISPIGTPGELCISGYLLQKGYWGNKEQTSAVMKCDEDGIMWMHTGDQAVLDREGYLKIKLASAQNLSPIRIEDCLTSHPEIVEAAVIAVPDERFGEVVGAWILLRPDAKSFTRREAVDWVKSKMNPQNAPSRVWLLGEAGAPAELPKTASGKVMKNVLRDWAKEMIPAGDISLGLMISYRLTKLIQPYRTRSVTVIVRNQPSLPSARGEIRQYSSTRAGSGSTHEFSEGCVHNAAKKSHDSSIKAQPKAQLEDEYSQSQHQKVDSHQFEMAIHPEGLPYFYQDKFVTYDNVNDPNIKKLTVVAVAFVCYMLRNMKDTQSDFAFHEEVELCIELKTTNYPPEFNYYIVDHAKQSIFWADIREPESIKEIKGIARDNILREEYWKHVEYYPCHREASRMQFEELKDLMAACATGKYLGFRFSQIP
ncbi:AMP-binding enzyme C-terminal domain [Rhizoctonia solani]|uniref:AMP-binding enzyme C-terminal domain n=1 Tax=Rhizoctonia solani TaxID=456999 RepID=A0A8H7LIW8_9AGAM|nr:AMP-binding enzyme C-terminal domain [Rhizoctonia solani]